MANYVIVHGGFTGGWEWRAVAQPLREAGHMVFTPTLTGLGEKAHLAHPQIGLNTHIQDIVGVLLCEDLEDVILVGHSSSSMVITGVAEKTPERLGRLVYIDTAIPQNGQSWFDLLGPELAQRLRGLADQKGNGWAVPLMNNPPKFQPHPLKTVTDPLTIQNPAAVSIPRAFVHCVDKPADSPLALAWPAIDRSAVMAKEQGWWYRTLPTEHAPHRTMPQELAQLLLELA